MLNIILKSTSCRGMFLAILGFIGCAFSLMNVFSGFNIGVGYGVVTLFVLVIQVICALGLYTFSSKVKYGLENRDVITVNSAFKGIMIYFLCMLISMISSFCLPLIVMLIS